MRDENIGAEVERRIDAVLAHDAVWEPPAAFAARVAASASPPPAHRGRRTPSPGAFDAAVPGVLIAAAGSIAGLIAEAAPTFTWLCAALSLWVGVAFTRRTISGDRAEIPARR
jgi:hypothetical protein